jgi:uncharacterized protein (DUF1501 family)
MMKRREFLKITSAATVMLASPFAVHAAQGNWRRTLVLVELKGGNDGLNTVAPYADPAYRKLRPNLSLASDKVIQISEKLGFHPSLEPLMPLWKKRHMAVTLGLGYPKPNLSHFRGIDIWDTGADSKEVLEQGWISRLFAESKPPSDFAADAIMLGRHRPGPVMGGGSRIVSLKSQPAKFLKKASKIATASSTDANPALAHLLKSRQDLRSAAEKIIAKKIENIEPLTSFPETGMGEQFAVAARLLIAGVETPVIKLSINGFDTHVDQEPTHGELLAEVAGGVAAFAAEMDKHGLWSDVVVMTYSEFGRRATENNSAGTDHGTAAPHFMIGGRVNGGVYGQYPDLTDLVKGNLKHTIHYRSLYATLAREWWGLDASFINEKSLRMIS